MGAHKNHLAEVILKSIYNIGLYEELTTIIFQLSRPMGKPTICLGENKGADQLRGNREADQRLCFRYSDSTIPLRNFKLLALFCACTGQFVSDLFGNHIVGFPTRWLNYHQTLPLSSPVRRAESNLPW